MVVRRKDLLDEFYARNSEIFKSKAEAKKVFDDMFDMIEDSLKAGNTLVITGFGKFWVSKLKARPVRNPIKQTTSMGVPKNAMRFTPSQVIQGHMNEVQIPDAAADAVEA